MRPRKKIDEEGASSGLIQIMTVSLFIILLAFFILLNSIAVVDNKKKRVALGSLLDTFNFLAGGFSAIERQGGFLDVPQLPTKKGRIDFSDLTAGDELLKQHLQILAHRDRSTLRIAEEALFEEPQSIAIKENAGPFLDRLAELIRQNEGPVDIIGHMDNVPVDAASHTSNRDISAQRALAILKYLIGPGHVPTERLTAYGWGPYRPVASNQTPQSRAFNRRMEVIFEHWQPATKPEVGFTFRDFFFRVF